MLTRVGPLLALYWQLLLLRIVIVLGRALSLRHALQIVVRRRHVVDEIVRSESTRVLAARLVSALVRRLIVNIARGSSLAHGRASLTCKTLRVAIFAIG